MYLEHFKLTEHPFRLSPDPKFLYLSEQHSRAKAYMESTVWFTDGFVVITGEIGAGKTTLIEKFLSELDETVTVARIAQTQITAVQFLQAVLSQFGFRPFRMRKAELIDTLNRHLEELLTADRKVVIVVDEGQNLEPRVLEEIRLLSGVGAGREKVLSIILAGQPELSVTLDSPDFEQLAQRTRLRFHLKALTREETGAYIEHRLKIAGAGDDPIIQADCNDFIYRYTGGIPRLINTLCDTALLCAYIKSADTVDPDDFQEAVDELQWIEYGARTGRFAAGVNAAGRSAGRLMVAHRDEPPREFAVDGGRMIIGRTPDNDLQIDSKYVSRHHAQIIGSRKGPLLEDLNSTNGIYVGGKRVKKHYLHDGDVFVIGEHELMYVGEDEDDASEERDALQDVDAEDVELQGAYDEDEVEARE